MSRICVKNLPKHVAEDRLREFFSHKGEITDAKLMSTKDGKSRQFGFVGFPSEREAEEALKFFNNSFMDTCRITCEVARNVGDPDRRLPWRRHSLKKLKKFPDEKKEVSSSQQSKRTIAVAEKDIENDPQLQEFLQVMQPRIKSKLWGNDAVAVPWIGHSGKSSDKEFHVLEGKKEMTSVAEKLNEIGEEGKSLELENREAVSDMDNIRSRVKKDWSDSEENEDESGGRDDDLKKSHEAATFEPMLSLNEEDVLETGRLFVRNLPYTTTEDDLEEHFNQFGDVSHVHLVVDKDAKRSKGFAYVLYSLPESAARALEQLDNSIFQGRLLHVMPAKQKTTLVGEEWRKKGRHLKLVEIREHGTVCSCDLIQLLKTLPGNLVLAKVICLAEKLLMLLYVLLWEKLK